MARTRRTHSVIETPSLPATPERSMTSEIARRAYELYELQGRADGHDLADWFQAERELQQVDTLKAS
jgi:hypothetical protein